MIGKRRGLCILPALALTLAFALGAPGCASWSASGERPATKLPSDFPDDLPPYPGATLVEARSLPEGALSASWETSAAPEAVSRFYRAQLVARGWSTRERRHGGPETEKQRKLRERKQRAEGGSATPPPEEPPGPEERMILALKGPRSATLMVSQPEGTTRIDLMLVEEEAK